LLILIPIQFAVVSDGLDLSAEQVGMVDMGFTPAQARHFMELSALLIQIVT
jgi:hypothetical protein